MTSARGYNVSYVNSLNYPIMASVTAWYPNGSAYVICYVDGQYVGRQLANSGGGSQAWLTLPFIIPPKASYTCGGNNMVNWVELY